MKGRPDIKVTYGAWIRFRARIRQWKRPDNRRRGGYRFPSRCWAKYRLRQREATLNRVNLGIENSASHLRAVASRLIASDRKWLTSGSQARRLVKKTRRLSGGFHDLYRGYFRVYRTCCGTTIITVISHDTGTFNVRAGQLHCYPL